MKNNKWEQTRSVVDRLNTFKNYGLEEDEFSHEESDFDLRLIHDIDLNRNQKQLLSRCVRSWISIYRKV